jgi:hypothetical protein
MSWKELPLWPKNRHLPISASLMAYHQILIALNVLECPRNSGIGDTGKATGKMIGSI